MRMRAILEKARAFVEDRPLSDEDKTSYTYCIGAEFGAMPVRDLTDDVLSRYYERFYERRETTEEGS